MCESLGQVSGVVERNKTVLGMYRAYKNTAEGRIDEVLRAYLKSTSKMWRVLEDGDH